METLQKIVGAIGLVIIIVAGIAVVMSLPVWLLWNWLMPEIFGLKEITWLQALGLLMLSGCLFRSSGSSCKKS